MKASKSYDFYLILATAIVLFIISSICIYGMFYFKLAQIQQMSPVLKIQYMNSMNNVVAPFVISLILLLGICVPKRIFSTTWLNRFAIILTAGIIAVSFLYTIKIGLLVVLVASLILQLLVLVMAVLGSRHLNFEKKGYWVRVGSSLIHLGLILFILDLFLYDKQVYHLILFWITTISTVTGMLFCFYAESVVRLFGKLIKKENEIVEG